MASVMPRPGKQTELSEKIATGITDRFVLRFDIRDRFNNSGGQIWILGYIFDFSNST